MQNKNIEQITQVVPFVAHNNLIKQIIFRQHGEHFKAVVELIQNSIDANATEIRLRFDENGFEVDDNGIGFLSIESVTNYFQTFGTPHVDGDATFGTFRIGRGQVMSLANCSWRTNLWQMDVDLKNEKEPEPSFTLTTYDVNQKKQGCCISGVWHTPMNRMQAETQRKQLHKAIGFLSIPIIDLTTGNRVNNARQLTDWDIETDKFYFKHIPDSEMLTVYNLGVLVKNLDPSALHGAAGILLSKKQFKMNTARETIMPSCLVWKEVSNHVAKFMRQYIEKNGKNKANSASRKGFLLSWLHGEQSDMSFNTPLFQDYRKSYHSIIRLLNYKAVCVIDKNECGYSDIVIDKIIMQYKHHILFVNTNYLQSLGYNDFFALIRDCKKLIPRTLVDVIEFDEFNLSDLNKGLSDKHTIIKDNELTAHERHILSILRKAYVNSSVRKAIMDTVADYIRDNDLTYRSNGQWYKSNKHEAIMTCIQLSKKYNEIPDRYDALGLSLLYAKIDAETPQLFNMLGRKIYFGESDTAQAWTDGKSYIGINRHIVPKLYEQGYDGFFALSQIIMHEICHDESNEVMNEHGLEFYEMFHKLTQGTDVLTKSSSYQNPTVLLARQAHKEACKYLLQTNKPLPKNYRNQIPSEFIENYSLVQVGNKLAFYVKPKNKLLSNILFIDNIEQLIMFLEFLGLNSISEFRSIILEAELFLMDKYGKDGVIKEIYFKSRYGWYPPKDNMNPLLSHNKIGVYFVNVGMIIVSEDERTEVAKAAGLYYESRFDAKKIMESQSYLKVVTEFVEKEIGHTRLWAIKRKIDDAITAATGKSSNIMHIWDTFFDKKDIKKYEMLTIKELKKLAKK